jgi:hypothetical protein
MMTLYSAANQMSGEPAKQFKIGDAVAAGMNTKILLETLVYN